MGILIGLESNSKFRKKDTGLPNRIDEGIRASAK